MSPGEAGVDVSKDSHYSQIVLCVLLVDQNVSSPLYLPPCFYSANTNPSETISPIKCCLLYIDMNLKLALQTACQLNCHCGPSMLFK